MSKNISLSDSVENNVKILQKKIEENNYNIVIKNGKILFKDIDGLKIRINSSDKILKSDITIFIFRKSNDDLLIDTELLLYPQYVSLSNDKLSKLINNKRINNILTSFETYVNLMKESRSNNNKKVGQKHLDIVKSKFNKDVKLDDLRNYCAPEGQCSRSLCCQGSDKYYYLFTRGFNKLSDLFYIYALRRSSKEKHHRESSNWSNKIIKFEAPHLSDNNYEDDYGSKISWSEIDLDVEAKHNTDNQAKRINSGRNAKCDLNSFNFKNKSEIEKKVKQIVKVVKNTHDIRYLTLSLTFLVHSNRILIDIKNKRIIRIEPHGFGRQTFYNIKQMDCLLKHLLNELNDFDYINEAITNNDIPKEYLSLFNSYSVQGSLPLCQMYSSYIQLLSIHYPKYTIITLNEIVSKHNISKRIQNFFKLFFEFLDHEIQLNTFLKNEGVKLGHVENKSRKVYDWLFTQNPEELNPSYSKDCQKDKEEYEKHKKKYYSFSYRSEQDEYAPIFNPSKAKYQKCNYDYKFSLYSNHIVTLRKELSKIHNLSEKFVRNNSKNTKKNTKKSSYSNVVKNSFPVGWCKKDHKGRPYYQNSKSRKSQWKKPHNGSNNIPLYWCKKEHKGRPYYYNTKKRKSQWKKPNI